jgi:hypothetical protein
MAAGAGLQGVVAAPARHVSYTAPELGYPGRACRVCGRRPCVIRLRWWVGACRSAFFCTEHTAAANRACRILKAGDSLPGRPEPLWSASPGPLTQGAGDVAGFV